MAGLDEAGLTIKRLPEIIEDIEESERTLIDPEVSTSDNTILGILNNIWAAPIADLWALTQTINDNYNASAAEGNNLEDLALLVLNDGRQPGITSKVDSQFLEGPEGLSYTTTNLVLANEVTGDRFVPQFSGSISISSCDRAILGFTVVNGASYSVTIDGDEYSYVSDADATAEEIALGLYTTINAGAPGKNYFVLNNTNEIELHSSVAPAPIVIEISINCNVVSVRAPVAFESEDEGAIVAPARSVKQILLGVPGLTSTFNWEEYVVGDEQESDDDLRERIFANTASRGSVTAQSIQAALTQVPSVISALVIENDTDAVDLEGRPPHSYECIVEGGDDTDIATVILSQKPAGIPNIGTTSVGVLDGTGVVRSVNFSRPATDYFAIYVQTGGYSAEVVANIAANIPAAIKSYVDTIHAGENYVPSRLYQVLYDLNLRDQNGAAIIYEESQAVKIANSGDAPGAFSNDVLVPNPQTAKLTTELIDIVYTNAS